MNKFDIYSGKRILVTGHTGFKGSWLTQWLLELDSDVYGYALEPVTSPSLFEQLDLANKMNSEINDVRDFDALKNYLQQVRPDMIFHLAAQPLVKESYDDPVGTWETNVNGTINLLEAVRVLNLKTSILVVTSDKCYENKEWIYGYRENDPLGGYDPYSASKGATEIAVSSYRRSFFNPRNFDDHGVKIASGRAGNVIGGGDWSKDRIVPDCIRALELGEPIKVRNPLSTRPWQHVLESLGGYMLLGSLLLGSEEHAELKKYCDSFNFGPYSKSNKTVELLVEEVLKHWDGKWSFNKDDAVHEAFLLNLNIDKASQTLGWNPVWGFEDTVRRTVSWYKQMITSNGDAKEITRDQILEYSKDFFTKIK